MALSLNLTHICEGNLVDHSVIRHVSDFQIDRTNIVPVVKPGQVLHYSGLFECQVLSMGNISLQRLCILRIMEQFWLGQNSWYQNEQDWEKFRQFAQNNLHLEFFSITYHGTVITMLHG